MDRIPVIYNEPCRCPPGLCAHFVEPDSECVHRLIGNVRAMVCAKCGGMTWHKDKGCLRCLRRPVA
jgi:hypothetical protein